MFAGQRRHRYNNEEQTNYRHKHEEHVKQQALILRKHEMLKKSMRRREEEEKQRKASTNPAAFTHVFGSPHTKQKQRKSNLGEELKGDFVHSDSKSVN